MIQLSGSFEPILHMKWRGKTVFTDQIITHRFKTGDCCRGLRKVTPTPFLSTFQLLLVMCSKKCQKFLFRFLFLDFVVQILRRPFVVVVEPPLKDSGVDSRPLKAFDRSSRSNVDRSSSNGLSASAAQTTFFLLPVLRTASTFFSCGFPRKKD